MFKKFYLKFRNSKKHVEFRQSKETEETKKVEDISCLTDDITDQEKIDREIIEKILPLLHDNSKWSMDDEIRKIKISYLGKEEEVFFTTYKSYSYYIDKRPPNFYLFIGKWPNWITLPVPEDLNSDFIILFNFLKDKEEKEREKRENERLKKELKRKKEFLKGNNKE